MRTDMPIGIDDFEEARSKYYLVDKTAFLSEFLQHHASVTLFTRPRRFGKTLTLSMVKTFLEQEHAQEHRKLFDGLDVSRDAATMVLQGTRPVIFLTFKELKLDSWELMQAGLRRCLSLLFRQYRGILDEVSDDVDREEFEAIRKGTADIITEMGALGLLIRLLKEHAGVKPVLLLDEYDVPVQQGWTHGFYKEIIGFLRIFLSTALKTNPYLDFAILTGVLRISKESIFSDLNNLQVDSLVSSKYPTVFGFTEAEVAQMAEDLGHGGCLADLRDWYDGYRFENQAIYNPWSVLKYFDAGCIADTYWGNTSGNEILKKLLPGADQEAWATLSRALQRQPVSAMVRENFIYDEIGRNKNALYTLLLTTGYLTFASRQRTDLGIEAELVIPNREILALFRMEVLERFQNDLLSMNLERLMQAFLTGDVDAAQRGLSEYIELLASTFDTAAKEVFYHGMLLGMTAVLVPEYDVKSNRESGRGRYDIAVFPKGNKIAGMIMEFKWAKTEQELQQKAKAALEQIGAKDYAAEFHARSVHTVYCYGIAFCGKNVLVRMM